MAELKAGGEDLRGAMLASRRFNCINCDHVPGTNPHDCIKDLIGIPTDAGWYTQAELASLTGLINASQRAAITLSAMTALPSAQSLQLVLLR